MVFQLGDWVGNCNYPIVNRQQIAKYAICVRPGYGWVLVGAIMSFGFHLITGNLVPPSKNASVQGVN